MALKAMFETEDEKFQRLLKCLEPLRENQVQIDSFTRQELISFYILLDRMIKHVRVLTTIPYKDVRGSVLAKANSLGICPLNHEMNMRHIYEVCLWMKTEAGIEAVVEVQRTEKLKRRATMKGMTLAEVSMVHATNHAAQASSSEGESSTMNDKKRRDAAVVGYGEEPLSKTRKK